MRTVRHACFAALIGILPASLLPISDVYGQEAAPAPASDESKAADTSKPAGKAKTKAAAKAGAADRLNLDATKVVGNRELPKVLYIVPWKRADIGELPGQPINSLLDEVLAPLDRDEYRREIRYYRAITSPAEQAAVGAPAPQSQTQPQAMPTEK